MKTHLYQIPKIILLYALLFISNGMQAQFYTETTFVNTSGKNIVIEVSNTAGKVKKRFKIKPYKSKKKRLDYAGRYYITKQFKENLKTKQLPNFHPNNDLVRMSVTEKGALLICPFQNRCEVFLTNDLAKIYAYGDDNATGKRGGAMGLK